MIKREITFDHQILEGGQIQVRQITRLMEDDKELSKTYHRHVVNPGDDLEKEDVRCQQIGQALHTPVCIGEYEQIMALNMPLKKVAPKTMWESFKLFMAS